MVLNNPLFVARNSRSRYEIDQSLRFNSVDTAYLNRTFSTPTDGTKWTYSIWIKRAKTPATYAHATGHLLTTAGSGAQGFLGFGWNATDDFTFGYGGYGRRYSSGLFRDPSAWYHIVVAVDTTQGSEENRALLYVNGSSFAWTTNTSIGLNDTTQINQAVSTNIGRQTGQPYESFDGNMAEINFIDGSALTPSSFGETDTTTGAWIPKKYSGIYGNNGFYLTFADNSDITATTLGKDSSGNGNNWTPNYFSVTAGVGNDVLSDTPTTNWCTLNPLDKNSGQIPKDGNLYFDGSVSTGGLDVIAGTIRVSSGKYYWESTITNVGSVAVAGVGITKIQSVGRSTGGSLGSVSGECAYLPSGNKNVDGTNSAYGSSFTTGDVIGVALDCDAGTVTFYKNNTSQGAITYAVGGGLAPAIGQVQGYGAIQTVNFGQRAFAHTPPTGYKALNTSNLPVPTIRDGGKYFDTKLYTGTGSTQSITGFGFSPDLVWIKKRNGTENHEVQDSVRGATERLASNTTDGETTVAGSISSFNSGGFTVVDAGTTNENTFTYVAWCWDKGATPGFDIVTYTGNGSNTRTISHNLGVTPAFFITKNRNGYNKTNGYLDWSVYHQNLAAYNTTGSQALYLHSTTNAGAAGGFFTRPTSTVFTPNQTLYDNVSSQTYVAYLWAEVEGFSKFGSYTGNNSSDGPFVFCGFRPAYILVKNSNSSTDEWEIYDTARDPYNFHDKGLRANTSGLEYDLSSNNRSFDTLSNGFKVRGSNAGINGSGNTHVFAAFAELPFKYANAR